MNVCYFFSEHGVLESLKETLRIEKTLKKFAPELREVLKHAKRDPEFRLIRSLFMDKKKRKEKFGRFEAYGSYNEEGDPLSARFFRSASARNTEALFGFLNTTTDGCLSRMFTKPDTSTLKHDDQQLNPSSNEDFLDIDRSNYIDIPKSEKSQFLDDDDKAGYVRVNSSQRIMQKLMQKKEKLSQKEKRHYQKTLLSNDNFVVSSKFNKVMGKKVIGQVIAAGKEAQRRFTNLLFSEIFSVNTTYNTKARSALFGVETIYHCLLYTSPSPRDS